MSKQYLYRVNILSKKNNHPLESIANYCGEEQFDLHSNKTYKSANSEKIVWNNILIPSRIEDAELYDNLPEFLKIKSKKPELISNARNILWRQVDCREIRPDSQFARVFQLAVPFFLNQEEATNLVYSFGKILVREGMICDASLHSHTKKPMILNLFDKLKINNQSEQPEHETHQDYTAFLMCTLRDFSNGIFENKNRIWNGKEKMKEWRYLWTQLLSDAIKNSTEANDEQKRIWNKKMNIYPEYFKPLDNDLENTDNMTQEHFNENANFEFDFNYNPEYNKTLQTNNNLTNKNHNDKNTTEQDEIFKTKLEAPSKMAF